MSKPFVSADILLPQNTPFEKWSVVACDQYTSQPEYWQSVEKIVGASPSTLRITLPEIYLEQADAEARIGAINTTMQSYLPMLQVHKNALIYVRRTLADGRVRQGIVGAVDLEEYDYNKGSVSQIRATEGTVLERIPPRVRVREGAVLETPHVMLLMDDRKKAVMASLATPLGEKLYDFELMMGGGHIEGYLLTDAETTTVLGALDTLEADFQTQHPNTPPLILAVGDGNHSLATAKACYENLKKTLSPEEAKNHPARYALAELVNLHDDALEFEPIHRVVFGCEPEKLLKDFVTYYESNTSTLPAQSFRYYYADKEGTVKIAHPASPLEVGTLQRFLDAVGAKTDYIHGEDVTKRLGAETGNIGFLLPPMDKNALFETVLADGVLPRKTFSMGEACEKRFYLECRKIR